MAGELWILFAEIIDYNTAVTLLDFWNMILYIFFLDVAPRYVSN